MFCAQAQEEVAIIPARASARCVKSHHIGRASSGRRFAAPCPLPRAVLQIWSSTLPSKCREVAFSCQWPSGSEMVVVAEEFSRLAAILFPWGSVQQAFQSILTLGGARISLSLELRSC